MVFLKPVKVYDADLEQIRKKMKKLGLSEATVAMFITRLPNGPLEIVPDFPIGSDEARIFSDSLGGK